MRLSKVSAFVLPQALVTVRHPEFDIEPVVKTWDDNAELLEFGPKALLYGLLDVVVDGHLAVLQDIDDEVEDAEDRLFDEHPRSGTDVQRQTYELRRQMTGVRKVVLPMRDVADVLSRHATQAHADGTPAQPTELTERWRDLRDHVLRANEWNDSLRDVVTTMFETGLSLADANLNQIVRKLSGWAAIIAVPTAVTGFYGQNVPYPGYAQEHGFITSSVITVVLAGGTWLGFHRRGWL
jgi:magnesium transporter